MEYFVNLLASFLAVMLVITVHEYAHAYVADKCGDPTARFAGRLSLNPVRHFDLFGIVMFAFVGFGWAKPVPINPYNFKNYKMGSFWTSAAGIIANYLMAFLFYFLAILVNVYVIPLVSGRYIAPFLSNFFSLVYVYSLNFCVFNLLPFYPLDGFRIVDALNKKRGKIYQFLRQYGYYILIGLIFLSFISDYSPLLARLDVLGYVLSLARELIGKPISSFWSFFFQLLNWH